LVIQERLLNPQLSSLDPRPSATYARGNDLSGSFGGAGGIGGLLARTDEQISSSSPLDSTAFYHSDANGNGTALINAAQQLASRYLYGPFGSILAQDGPLSTDNPYCFSSKEVHRKSCTALYLYRAFTPHLQSWIGRDALREVGFGVAVALQTPPKG